MPEEEKEEDAKVFCPGLTEAVLNQIKKKSLEIPFNDQTLKVNHKVFQFIDS